MPSKCTKKYNPLGLSGCILLGPTATTASPPRARAERSGPLGEAAAGHVTSTATGFQYFSHIFPDWLPPNPSIP